MLYDNVETEWGGALVVMDEVGISRISLYEGRDAPMPLFDRWRRSPSDLREAVGQLRAYFAGELREFDLPLSLNGTDFQMKVWNALKAIPYGTTVSYLQLAASIDKPKACRAVGGANGRNPVPVVIPCHRVIGANGSLGGYSGGLGIKRRLLAIEGVHFD